MPDKQEKNKLVSSEPKKEVTVKNTTELTKRFFSNPDHFLGEEQKLSEHAELQNSKDKLTPAQEKRKGELMNEIAYMYGLENGVWSANLSYHQNYLALAGLRRKIVKDYDCKTSLELMLADRIVASYWRAMRNDTLLNHYIEDKDGSFSFSQLKINGIREFNKGLERADRQLNADIMLLKELKQPKLNIKVSTENAYIAQNQQVVNTDKNGSKTVSGESLEVNDLGKK